MRKPAPARSSPVIIETEEQAAQERAELGQQMQRLAGPQLAKGVYLPPRFGYQLSFTLAVLAWFLVCTATVYFIIWDQRYRCRVCLRRLRMPIETGSWSRMLQFGRPRIEYICTYGHGTLKEEELQISGLANAEWTPHSDDMWDELCASSKDPGEPFVTRKVPRWRIAAAIVILAGMLLMLGMFAPYYFRNVELQNFVSGVTHRGENQTKSDDVLRGWVLDKAHELNLPVMEDNVHITRSPDSMHIDVRYIVRVTLPGYTVDLHFYPGAGSR